jgi:hypothetical protein
LHAARIENNDRGMPASFSGARAIVFAATVAGEALAIRCFTRNVPAVRERYAALYEHLKAAGAAPDYLVGFVYQDQGAMVEGVRYPLLRMDWSAGLVLRKWTEANRKHGQRLRALAERWRDVMEDLRVRGIAHGDLASDNCLVRSASDFTLIDYDGCFVTRLAHAHPGEFGHSHYQHPKRPGYYGPAMDAFPALVIYLSLLAVAAEPALWDAYNDGDANLIFSEDDYLKPGGTDIWRQLHSSPDSHVRALTDVLAAMCTKPVESLPPLSEVLSRLENRSPRAAPEFADDVPDDLYWIGNPITDLDRPGSLPTDLDWIDNPMIGLEGRPLPSTPAPTGPGPVPAPPAKRRNWLVRVFRWPFGRSA